MTESSQVDRDLYVMEETAGYPTLAQIEYLRHKKIPFISRDKVQMNTNSKSYLSRKFLIQLIISWSELNKGF